MTRKFNLDEVLAMAERIERNGIQYYDRASQLVKNDEQKRTFRKLVEMERDHVKTFADMRSSQPSMNAFFDPDSEASHYLQAMVDHQIFDYGDSAVQYLADLSVVDVYRKAIDLEKDSIVFYLGIQELVPERFGRSKVSEIIREEMSHIALLSTDLGKEMEAK